jgi:hypothetical protein
MSLSLASDRYYCPKWHSVTFNKLDRTIEIDPEKAPIAKAMFEKYGFGQLSLSGCERN